MTTSRTATLLSLLDAYDEAPEATALRARSYELLRLSPGASVVDVGCGGGRAVAELLDQGAHAVGVDVDEEMVAAAKQRRPDADFRLGDAYALPFDDGELSGYRADKVIHVLDDPARALNEAQRVLAPGGRIVLLGQDWDAYIIDSDHPELTWTILRARAAQISTPRAARAYRSLLLEAGFHDAKAEVHTNVFTASMPQTLTMLSNIVERPRAAGAISDDEAETWLADQHARAKQDRLFLAIPLILASASK
ncbi:methyltransferase domain-containing protein [Allokutzneria sp. A3M-2-11 16]|uniref:methyltransferase domain-containing protein n=1 Tax=Allokutzneria sp. A3M-2-11 16 TaxID=2962043 RepID=UPI0020B6A0D4|nr:methyltransferase domain-containing protein [Allokutzneria sp. A3M-2-11 16]MCP3803481.1 methyltransferase domain-containing protein [Allokutzneria sp. A3M-2-11 16]